MLEDTAHPAYSLVTILDTKLALGMFTIFRRASIRLHGSQVLDRCMQDAIFVVFQCSDLTFSVLAQLLLIKFDALRLLRFVGGRHPLG